MKKEEFEIIKICGFAPMASKDSLYFDDIKEFKKLVLSAFELPDGTLVGVSEVLNYYYKTGGIE